MFLKEENIWREFFAIVETFDLKFANYTSKFSQEQSYRCATFTLKIRADFVENFRVVSLESDKSDVDTDDFRVNYHAEASRSREPSSEFTEKIPTPFGLWILQQPLTQRRLYHGFVNFLEASDDPLRIYYESRVCPNEHQSAFRIRVLLYNGSCIPKRVAALFLLCVFIKKCIFVQRDCRVAS